MLSFTFTETSLCTLDAVGLMVAIDVPAGMKYASDFQYSSASGTTLILTPCQTSYNKPPLVLVTVVDSPSEALVYIIFMLDM
jgi:hypothetical protein